MFCFCSRILQCDRDGLTYINMADASTKAMIVSEILCYIQCKMNTSEHDHMVKSVVSFYKEDDIHEAKILLFEECQETKSRLKTYKIDKATKDCTDIINKFNEVGSQCPKFVAADLTNVPLVTPDAFNLAKLSLDIEAVMKLESHVSSSYAALSCLQTDFNTVLEKCSKIDMLIDEIAALKMSMSAKDSCLTLTEVTAVPADASSVIPSESSDDSSSCDGDVESAADDAAPPRVAPRPAPRHNVKGRKVVPAGDDERRTMSEGGFTYVEMARKNIAKSNSTRIFTNSSLKPSQKNKTNNSLKTVSRKRPDSSNYSAVFISNLTPDTKPADITKYLHSKFERHFKVFQIPGKFKDCSSFKVVTQDALKGALLNKENWAPGVYVREFYDKAGGAARLPTHQHSI